MARRLVELTTRRGEQVVEKVRAHVDINSDDDLRKHLTGALRRNGVDDVDRFIRDYTLDVRKLNETEINFSYVVSEEED